MQAVSLKFENTRQVAIAIRNALNPHCIAYDAEENCIVPDSCHARYFANFSAPQISKAKRAEMQAAI
jgi:hypothetical protein